MQEDPWVDLARAVARKAVEDVESALTFPLDDLIRAEGEMLLPVRSRCMGSVRERFWGLKPESAIAFWRSDLWEALAARIGVSTDDIPDDARARVQELERRVAVLRRVIRKVEERREKRRKSKGAAA